MDPTATGHWRRSLEKMPADQLFRLRDLVNEVTAQPGWREIIGLISKAHDDVLKSLTQGATRPHAEQSRTIGYLAGLEEAPNVVQAIVDAASRREQKLQERAVADERARQESP